MSNLQVTNETISPAVIDTTMELGLLKRRPFRLFSYSRFFSRVAQNALNFGLVLLIVDETGLAVMSSLLVLALVVPSTVLGIVAGHAADTLPKRLLIFLGNVARAALCIWFVRDGGGVLSFYLIAIGLASVGQFAATAEGAMQPLLVERHEMARANALSNAIGGAAQLVGLGIMAPVALRAFDSPEALFIAAAFLYLLAAASAVLVGRVRPMAREEVGTLYPGSPLTAGWRAMKADPAVMQAAVELTLISATLIILGGLIPSFISDTLGLPIEVGAAILLPAALGVAFGLRIAGFLAHRLPHALLSSAGFFSFVALLLGLTFVNPESSFLAGYSLFSWLDEVNIGSFDGAGVLAVLIMAPLGFAFATVTVSGQTVLNDRVPLQLQGRVNATQNAMAALASSLPVIIAGFLADVVGVTAVMAIVGMVIGGAAVANLRPRHATGADQRLRGTH